MTHYPSEILPKPHFTGRITLDASDQGLYFIRGSSLPFHQLFLENQELSVDKIVSPTEEMARERGLSMSLLGIYKSEYIRIKVRDARYHEAWTPGESVPPATDIEVEERESYPLFLSFQSLWKKPFPYNEISDVSGFPAGHGFSDFEHCPTLCNYWHFVFALKKSDGTWITKEEVRPIKKQIKQFLRTYLLHGIQDTCVRHESLSEGRYTS